MGKINQIMNKESESQGQGVCEKIFKLAVNISPNVRLFRQISPQFSTTTKPKIDANQTTISKPVAIADHQVELNQNLSTASNNMVKLNCFSIYIL